MKLKLTGMGLLCIEDLTLEEINKYVTSKENRHLYVSKNRLRYYSNVNQKLRYSYLYKFVYHSRFYTVGRRFSEALLIKVKSVLINIY